MRNWVISAVAALALAAGTSTPVSASTITISSLFTTSLEGWTTTDTLGTMTQQATGGNPGGFLSHDNSELIIAQLIAPAAFLGDLSAFIGGTFSFDGSLLGNGGLFFDGPNGIPGGVYLDYGIIQFIGPSLTAQIDLLPNGAVPPLGSWQKFSVGLNAAAFGLSSANFSALMQNVTGIRITIEGLWGNEIEGVDNITLQSPDTAVVPEPATLGLLAAGLVAMVAATRRRTGRLLRARQ